MSKYKIRDKTRMFLNWNLLFFSDEFMLGDKKFMGTRFPSSQLSGVMGQSECLVYKQTTKDVVLVPTSINLASSYSPVSNRSAGTITFFLEKIQRGMFIWSGTFWYKSPKNRGLWKKLPILWRKKHSSEPETKVIFCFVLASETKVMLIRIAVEPV